MRKIVMLRGAQGAGKSTFVHEQGLDSYVISSDTIRLLFSSPVMSASGKMIINHEYEHKVWSLIEELLELRMSRGEFIVVDATFQKKRDFLKITKRAKLYRYEMICIDFSEISLETVLQRNKQRPEYRQVSEQIITATRDNILNEEIPNGIMVLPYYMFADQRLIDYLDVKKINLNSYKKVHHIGDIQGCFEPVQTYFKDGFKKDEFYIFVGDFLDRGIQNAEVMQFVLHEIVHLPNVILIWGNHETHIHNFALDKKIASREFNLKTLPQLMKIHFSKEQAELLCQKLVDCFVYEYQGYNCFVSHAGISKVPQNPVLIPSVQYWKGSGGYDEPVDQLFAETMADTPWIQMHGHRNKQVLPVQASIKSFNLEGQVEFGGYLRAVILHDNGYIETKEIKNNIYSKQQDFQHSAGDEFGKISKDVLEKLEQHHFVRIKKFKAYPHISGYTFKPAIFSKRCWDDLIIKARGLFVDSNRAIVARSYNKFFNLGELPSTTIDALSHRLKFPVSIYVKENGYLGILGYDEQTDDLFFSSKSTPESVHAQYFQKIVMQQIGQHNIALLKNYIRKHNVSFVFEVIDIVNDPHIIEYESTKVVLLDIINRIESFSCLPYKELEKVSAQFGFECKKRAMYFQDWNSFLGWYQSVQRAGKNYTFQGKHIEGFVIQDNEGYLCKIKLPYYSFWRYMRGIRDQLLEMKTSGKAIRAEIYDQDALHFYNWISQKTDDVLSKSIIELRNMYVHEHGDRLS